MQPLAAAGARLATASAQVPTGPRDRNSPTPQLALDHDSTPDDEVPPLVPAAQAPDTAFGPL